MTGRVVVRVGGVRRDVDPGRHAAKEWMDAQPKTGASLFEPYLAMVQASPSGTAGSWNTPWSALAPARQAAVIVAARAAANDECG
ncbi:lipoprotein LpqV [Mycobacterium avium]|uniref:lipoprotein LpqV n=1 Tax=Mycobacterium avium TaxID=1764 RepID=UPI001F3DAC34|nr:lipoprotein LpqV [Mycobacterium avium]